MSNDSAPRGLLLVMIDIDPAWEEEFNLWYREEHYPERMACPGFRTGRRYVAKEGSPKYLALYELESAAVLESPQYLEIAGPTERTARLKPHFVRHVRNVYVEIEP